MAVHGKPVAEKAEQAHGIQLLETLGAKVYVIGTKRRRGDYPGTMQTPGIPDVYAFLPPRGTARRVAVWWECKAEGGRERPEQGEFRQLCYAAEIHHVLGPFDTLIEFLARNGYVSAHQFPHYRVPKPLNRSV